MWWGHVPSSIGIRGAPYHLHRQRKPMGGGGKGNEVSAALEAATATATATLEKVRSIPAGQKAMGK